MRQMFVYQVQTLVICRAIAPVTVQDIGPLL